MIDRRSALFAAAGGVVGALAIRATLEPRRLAISSHVVRSRGAVQHIARIAQLSDLHLRGLGSLERQIAHALHHARPDLIVITGDSISSRPALGPLDRFLGSIEGIAPGFAVLGNWDRWCGATLRELRLAYARRGFTLLVNESVRLEIHGLPVRVTGVDDLVSGQPSARSGLEAAREGESHVLLAHCPAYRERLWRELAEARPQEGWSTSNGGRPLPTLMLAGHTHGGQIRILGWAPVRPPGSGRYVAGWYRDARPHMYVSRGLGTSGVQLRFGAPPELAIFDVQLPG